MTLTKREAIALLEAHGLSPKRSLGQNFVVDPNTVRRIARLAEIGPGDRIAEIGPGLGSLTEALLDTGASVVAVELDHQLAGVLRERLAGQDLRVVEADARTADWDEVLPGTGWALVANLPYNVATTLVLDLLDHVPHIERMLVMVQLEVGERLAAAPRADAYGAVSVKVAYWATASIVGKVPPTVFLPRPKVDSALVAIRRRSQPAVDPAVVPFDELFSLVRAGFGQRRKMLRRSLHGLVPPEAFAAADVSPEARAEELDVVAWGRLTAAVRALGGSTS